jgi:heme exporter protein B
MSEALRRPVVAKQLWWIIHKDLLCEYRGRRVWPAMVVLGVVVVLILAIQMGLLPDQKQQICGGMLWLAIFFAAVLALDRSFAAEHDDGCWNALQLYGATPTTVYLAKVLVNGIWITAIEALLIPLFIVLADVPLLRHPVELLLVVFLGNVGLAAAGTLLGAMTAGLRKGGNLTAMVVLPITFPQLMAAAEATRLLTADVIDAACWRWLQLLGLFALMFLVAGAALVDFVVEE